MKSLVTEASDFIGQSLRQVLVDRGDGALGLVRSTPNGNLGVTMIRADQEDEFALSQAQQGIESVVLVAGRARFPSESAPDPQTALRATSRDATLRLAELARDAGVKRFVLMNSIEASDFRTESQAISKSSAVEPHADYARSTPETGEDLKALLESSPIALVVTHPPLVYAPHTPDNFRRLLKLAPAGAPLPFSLVNKQRTMTALENLVDFIPLRTVHPQAAKSALSSRRQAIGSNA